MDRLIGLDGVLSDIAMMRTDGHGRVELTKFRRPTADSAEPNNAPPNTLVYVASCLPSKTSMMSLPGSAPTVPNWLASWCSTTTAISSVMFVALRASSSRSPRRSADDSGTVVATRREGGLQGLGLHEPERLAALFETRLAKPWRTSQ